MLKAIEAYLALRRATEFAMLNAEWLLRSFAAFATERGQTHVHAQTAIEWAARGPSAAQRDTRLRAVCRFARHVRVEDARHELPPVHHFGVRKTWGMRSPPTSRVALRPARAITCSCAISRRFDRSGPVTASRRW